MKNLTFTITEDDELLSFIMKRVDGMNRTKAKKILANDTILVDGRPVSQYNFPLKPGMELVISKTEVSQRFKNRLIKIVYEDDYIIVIEKAEGLLSNSLTPTDESAQSLLNQYLENSHQKCHAHIVHRLDRDTSGLMLFAKDKKVALGMEEDWHEKVYDRRYIALVGGEMTETEGTIKSYLIDDSRFITHSSRTNNGGKLAVTHFRTLQKSKDFSLVELKLETGRKNQIRVHLQDLGHPVVGDRKYGDGSDPIGRLGLHAYKLCFYHPVTGKDLKFETEIPPLFRKLTNDNSLNCKE